MISVRSSLLCDVCELLPTYIFTQPYAEVSQESLSITSTVSLQLVSQRPLLLANRVSMQLRATDTTHVAHETDVTIRIWRTGRPRCLSIHTRSSHFWEWCEIEAFVLVNMSLSTVSPLLPDAHHRPTAIWCATKNRGEEGGVRGGSEAILDIIVHIFAWCEWWWQ